MQRYFTLQIFECFDIPIDDLWAEFAVLMVCACVDACTHFFAGTQFYALHKQQAVRSDRVFLSKNRIWLLTHQVLKARILSRSRHDISQNQHEVIFQGGVKTTLLHRVDSGFPIEIGIYSYLYGISFLQTRDFLIFPKT